MNFTKIKWKEGTAAENPRGSAAVNCLVVADSRRRELRYKSDVRVAAPCYYREDVFLHKQRHAYDCITDYNHKWLSYTVLCASGLE